MYSFLVLHILDKLQNQVKADFKPWISFYIYFPCITFNINRFSLNIFVLRLIVDRTQQTKYVKVKKNDQLL